MSMGAFDQEVGDVPAVVREYHRARRVWLENSGTDTPARLDALVALQTAAEALIRAVDYRGGVWDVGRLRYRVDGEGFWVEQRPEPDAGDGDGGG